MKWDKNALIGNYTVEQLLTSEIDIQSEKIKLTKFLSEYDMSFMPEELVKHPHLTLKDLASHPKKIEGIPFSIVEDDLPKIKPRHYSITNDPYYNLDTNTIGEKSHIFTFCFTVH